MKIMIVNGGMLREEFLKKKYEEEKPDFLIAADGALTLIDRAGLAVTHIVGDFDTVSESVLEKYTIRDIYVERHRPEKDETDSELAMEIALQKHPDEIVILGATGYRMDHTLANLQLLYRAYEEKVSCRIADEQNEIFLVSGSASFDRKKDWKYLSFLPFSDQVSDICMEGFKYCAQHADFKKGIMPGFGVSNEIISEQAFLSVGSGILYGIRSKDAGEPTARRHVRFL